MAFSRSCRKNLSTSGLPLAYPGPSPFPTFPWPCFRAATARGSCVRSRHASSTARPAAFSCPAGAPARTPSALTESAGSTNSCAFGLASSRAGPLANRAGTRSTPGRPWYGTGPPSRISTRAPTAPPLAIPRSPRNAGACRFDRDSLNRSPII